ncbi:hypothetical protein [Deinococcus ficus]|uniref:hypothetical protein n=1 Tax=Deinococcus ficus TaxID=317577 RepID=UPI00131B6895|nr:hypothetical protein [Deinococcus ficus]
MKKTRTSTKYTMIVGYVLVATVIGSVVGGFLTGAINESNIISLIWALLLTAAAFLGINLTRVTAENLATINTARDAATNPPVEPVTVTATDQGVKVSADAQEAQEAPFDLPPGYSR